MDVEKEECPLKDRDDNDDDEQSAEGKDNSKASCSVQVGPIHHQDEDDESQLLLKPRTRAQMIFGWALGDVLVYVTIINLFVEYIPQMRMDSFTISIVTSIVLKLVLEGVHYLQHKFQHFFCVQRKQRIIGAFFIWLVLFGSKFVILWIDETIFPTQVDLGGVKMILVLSLVLMLSEKFMRFLWWKLGQYGREDIVVRKESSSAIEDAEAEKRV